MSNLRGRLERLEQAAGVGLGVASVRLHWHSNAAPVRRSAGVDRVVYDLAVGGDCPFSRLHVLARKPTPEAARRPGEPTARRAAVVRARLMPLLDARQRRIVDEAGFVVVMPAPV